MRQDRLLWLGLFIGLTFFIYPIPGRAAAWQKLSGPWSGDCDNSFGGIAIHPNNSNIIYLGSSHPTNGCEIYKSVDAGGTWTPINNGLI
jgi:hypothetical protein